LGEVIIPNQRVWKFLHALGSLAEPCRARTNVAHLNVTEHRWWKDNTAFYTLELNKGKSVLMSSEKWKPWEW